MAFPGGPGGFRELREAGRNHFHLSWYLSDTVVTSPGPPQGPKKRTGNEQNARNSEPERRLLGTPETSRIPPENVGKKIYRADYAQMEIVAKLFRFGIENSGSKTQV